jgi:hypothetical protein
VTINPNWTERTSCVSYCATASAKTPKLNVKRNPVPSVPSWSATDAVVINGITKNMISHRPPGTRKRYGTRPR